MRRHAKIGWSWALALAVSACSSPQELPENPNLIVIALDTFRADHLGCYGNTEYATPHIDALAAESVLFERAYATAPWTLPSFTSAFTGLYPYRHGVVGGGRKRLSTQIATLAEILQVNGYQTKGYGAVGFFVESFGMTRGITDLKTYLDGPVSGRFEQYEAEVLEFMSQAPIDPYYLMVHIFDSHAPYQPPAPYDRMYYRGDPSDPAVHSLAAIYSDDNLATKLYNDPQQLYGWLEGITDIEFPVRQYGADISYVDEHVGKLITALRESGELERSIVVLMADHGEHLTEHRAWFTHAFPYEEDLHVPLMIRLPEAMYGGRRESTDVSLVDLLPTLLELMDLGLEGELDGVSLVPAMKGEDLPGRLLFAEQGDAHRGNMVKALWDENHRMLYYSLADSSWYELYDRKSDRAERNDLYDANSEVAKRLQEELWKRFPRRSPITTRQMLRTKPIPPEVQERLRALGYTQ